MRLRKSSTPLEQEAQNVRGLQCHVTELTHLTLSKSKKSLAELAQENATPPMQNATFALRSLTPHVLRPTHEANTFPNAGLLTHQF